MSGWIFFGIGVLVGMWLISLWTLYLCIRYDTCSKCGDEL